MSQAGQFHTLTVIDQQPQGLYLDDGQGNRILLPNRQIPEGTGVGDSLKVFLYFDSEDRLIATCQRPRIQLHQVAFLTVADVNNTGAFLDWGLPKDLFVPFAEQLQRMEEGKSYPVYLREDNTGRLIGTSRLSRHIKDDILNLQPGTDTNQSIWKKKSEPAPAHDLDDAPFNNGDAVKLLVIQRTDLGYKAIVNQQWFGLIHNDDIRTAIRPGMKIDAYIKRVRDDGRLDLSLERPGHHKADPIAQRIMKKLESNNGTLGLSDRSPADLIELHFGVSKRVFKMAIGQLYKERKIRIEPDAIYLMTESERVDAMKHARAKRRASNRAATSQPPQTAHNTDSVPDDQREPAPAKAEDTQPKAPSAEQAPKKKRIWKNNRPKTERTLGIKK